MEADRRDTRPSVARLCSSPRRLKLSGKQGCASAPLRVSDMGALERQLSDNPGVELSVDRLPASRRRHSVPPRRASARQCDAAEKPPRLQSTIRPTSGCSETRVLLKRAAHLPMAHGRAAIARPG